MRFDGPPAEDELLSDDFAESTVSGADTTRSESSICTPPAVDDLAVSVQPRICVDYLNHNWREEDIWHSWRHIVSQRKVYGERSRLENASWRSWAQSKYRLRTLSPEALNWLKESDVTWLYGPLKEADAQPDTPSFMDTHSRSTQTGSLQKKPILKKRSASQVMLQRSISTSSLVRRATASVQAQSLQNERFPCLQSTNSTFALARTPVRASTFEYNTPYSSDPATPSESTAPRHIRFDDKVEQCIAVECKVDEDEDEDDEFSAYNRQWQDMDGLSDSDSDDCLVMGSKGGKAPLPKKSSRKPAKKPADSKPARTAPVERKTIETLPATTLKYRLDSPDSHREQRHHTFGRNWGTATISPSPSQETLKPSYPSRNVISAGDKESTSPTSVPASTWSFGAHNPKSSLGAASPLDDVEPPRWNRRDYFGVQRNYSGEFHRSSSGMLLPEDDEDDMMAVGLFGRVSETINTAKDIAHVIWNVGWRK
ncbi:hypothetical protein K470DRAFT_219787 [Piedraia hortae CBS 480.64]|uniref:Nitrogen regulatory protein areA GATA-like domain-containing protein n=1 Tax=Piedraia hortae CBS 480.64 TaxID=1314780 RepID=A0A6A7BV05_9PEZI|nr:hypothetical protein K470DRAFT_219787 [Piedraia hortae CBS 480.64]